MIVSKTSFIFIIMGLSVLWYYLAALISKKLIGINGITSVAGLRILINLFFSVMSILLILSNT